MLSAALTFLCCRTRTCKNCLAFHTLPQVGGLPEDLQFELIEPLRELFKVRFSWVLFMGC